MATPRKRAALEADGRSSRERILDAAIDAFSSQGYAATATRDIATRAGVAEGTIFRYYATKQELLVAAAEPMMQRVLTPEARERVAAVLGAEYDSVEAFVRAVATDRLAFAREHPTLVRLVVQEIPFHAELRDRFRATVLRAFHPPLVEALERFMARGLLTPMPPASAARMVMSMVVGYALPRIFLAPDAPWDDDAEIALMARTLGRGMAPD